MLTVASGNIAERLKRNSKFAKRLSHVFLVFLSYLDVVCFGLTVLGT